MHHRAPTSGAFFILCAVGLSALAAVPYLNSIHGPWILDDLPIIARNPAVRGLRYWDLWTSDYWRTTGAQSGFYRPLTMTTYALNRAFGGLWTTGFHAVNIALHVACTLMLWRFCLGGACSFVSLSAAALFAVHPVHVEAVANVVGRSELLTAFFFLVTFGAHVGFRRATDRPLKATLAALMFIAAGAMLFSKESGVALLLFFPLYDYVKYGRAPEIRSQANMAYAALGFALIIYLFIRITTVGLNPGFRVEANAAYRFQLTATSVAKNLQLLIAPSGQRAVWRHSDMPPPDSLHAIAGAAVLLLFIVGIAYCIIKRPRLSPPVLLFFVSMAPLLHIKPNLIWVWERGLYVPSAALSWLLFEALQHVRVLHVARLVYIAVVAVIAVFIVRTFFLSGLYGDSLRFWQYQYEVDKDATTAMNYSQTLLQQRQPEHTARATEVSEAALRDHPQEGVLVAALADIYMREGRIAQANELLTSTSLGNLRFFTDSQQRLLLNRLAEQSQKAGAPTAAQRFAAELEALPPSPSTRR